MTDPEIEVPLTSPKLCTLAGSIASDRFFISASADSFLTVKRRTDGQIPLFMLSQNIYVILYGGGDISLGAGQTSGQNKYTLCKGKTSSGVEI